MTMATPSQLVERATAITGLSTLGDDAWREGLERLVDALDREADLPAASIQKIESALVARLVARLQIERWYDEHPETADQEIDGPVVILGLLTQVRECAARPSRRGSSSSPTRSDPDG